MSTRYKDNQGQDILHSDEELQDSQDEEDEDEEDEEGGDYCDVSDSEDDEEVTWIEWFCSLKGNEFFVEVEEEYIQDDFNLTGLSTQVPHYEQALNLILNLEDDETDATSEKEQALVEQAAQVLYGLIHARFILTTNGMKAMLEKYQTSLYGQCPNVYCANQPMIPIGLSDTLREQPVKTYCPRCQEVYHPRPSRLACLDGAYFGTTFAPMFFLTNPNLVPTGTPRMYYVPRVYGFKVHAGVKDRLRQQRKAKETVSGASSSSQRPGNSPQAGGTREKEGAGVSAEAGRASNARAATMGLSFLGGGAPGLTSNSAIQIDEGSSSSDEVLAK